MGGKEGGAVADEVNNVRNADFSQGREGPRWWVFKSEGRARWKREPSGTPGIPGGITVEAPQPVDSALWTQAVRCTPGKYYRIEASVSCDAAAEGQAGGCALVLEPFKDGGPAGERLTTPPLHRSGKPVAVRARYQVPDGIRSLRISVGLINAGGWATIHHVRVIRILEPDELSHPIAIPPPPFAEPAPLKAKDICVCSETAQSRPITRLLKALYGERRVHALAPADLNPNQRARDAVLLPDATPPRAIGSLKALLALAKSRLVVISLPAFATLSRGNVTIRRIEQDDDPIHAKVMCGHFATRGFALHDVFPYAWSGDSIGSFVQNQFRTSGEFKRFCEKHGFVNVLHSMCDKDATSGKPICLYKECKTTDERVTGGLFVLDTEPVEAESSTLGEPALAMHLLLSMLGREQVGLGQFTAPIETEENVRENLREMEIRFDPLRIRDQDVPAAEVTEQVITLGAETDSYGLPLMPKPMIVVRSGLTSGDSVGFYGVLYWFKQLVRAKPYGCPYVDRLLSRFSLSWIPLVAAWESRVGFRTTGRLTDRRLGFDASVAAILVDLVSTPLNRTRVVFPSANAAFDRYASWLPRLSRTFPAGSYFLPTAAPGEPFADRDRFAWRPAAYEIAIATDASVFEDEVCKDVIRKGGQAIRIEVPVNEASFSAESIHRTDMAATVLEQAIGLQYGMIAVNRRSTAVRFERFPPVAAGQALIIGHEELDRLDQAARVG
jgi:hypothetical protein